MSPHGFGHLYEISATFTVAYILIDELSENSFIRQISEKVLRKYAKIYRMFNEVKSTLTGHKTSLENIPKLGLNDPKIPGEVIIHNGRISTTELRVNNIWSKVEYRINKNYKTQTFIFLNFYLLLYSLGMLYFGGIYEGLISEKKSLVDIDKALFFFSTISFIVLAIGWFIDKTDHKKNETFQDIENATIISRDAEPRRANVYLIAIGLFVVIVILTVLWYYVFQIGPDFDNKAYHNILIFMTVFLPISNFVSYFFKANSRGNKTLEVITEGCEAICNQFKNDLTKVEEFMTYCKYIKEKDRKISLEIIDHDDLADLL